MTWSWQADEGRLSVPRLAQARAELSKHFAALVYAVVSGGHAADLDLAPGDLLVLGQGHRPGDVVVLVPRRFGRPMIGRVTRKGLVGEPGGIPVDARRWLVAGRLQVLIREDPRGGRVLALEPGRKDEGSGLNVQLRFEPHDAMQVMSLLSARLPGLHLTGPDSAECDNVALLAHQPLGVLGALARELDVTHRIRMRGATAPSRDAAMAIVDLLPAGAVASVQPDVSFMDLVRGAPAREIQEQEEQQNRQMGLFA